MKSNTGPPKPIQQFHDFIEISLSIGSSIEDIAKKIGRNYEDTLKYLNENDLLHKYRRHKWTHKNTKKRHKRTKKDPDSKKGEIKWPPKCRMFIGYENEIGQRVTNIELYSGGLL